MDLFRFLTVCLLIVVLAIVILWSLMALGFAHDIYPELTKNTPCTCGNTPTQQRCEVTWAVPDGKGNYYLPASGETIPVDIALPSPDDRFHRCTYPLDEYWSSSAQEEREGRINQGRWRVLPDSSTHDGGPRTRCFWAPALTN